MLDSQPYQAKKQKQLDLEEKDKRLGSAPPTKEQKRRGATPEQTKQEQTRIITMVLGTKDPYKRLQLPVSAPDVQAIRKAYNKLALLVHPDKCTHPMAGEAFNAICQAYELLANTQRSPW